MYATIRTGFGGTMGWGKGAKDPVGAIFNIAIGKYLSNNLRVDGEIGYHTKGKLYSRYVGERKLEIKYRQYDLGANAYYDFPAMSNDWVPFIGAGVWLVKSRASGQNNEVKIASSDKTHLAVSGAVGATYRLNEVFTAEAMGRFRYLFTKDNVYNLEVLLGIRADF